MEPTKSSALSKGCDPVSVNCVMWDGSDLCCVTFCKGDSIKDIVFEISRMLCRHETQLDMSTLDLKCLAGCATGNCDYDLLDVLQLIIDKLAVCCCDPKSNPAPTPHSYVPPNYTVPASMRYTNDNGDTVDTLGGESYLQLVGQTAGVLVDRADSTDDELSSQNTRITELENNPPPEYTPPTVEAPFIMGDNNEYQMPVVIEATDTYAEELNAVLGDNADIIAAVGKQGTVGTAAAFSVNGIVSSLPNWIASPQDMADALNNIWIYTQDLRYGVNEAITRTNPNCNQVIMDFKPSLVDNGRTAYLYFQAYSILPSGFTDDPSDSGSLKFFGTDHSGNDSADTSVSFSLEDAMQSAYIEVDLNAAGLTAYPFITFGITSNLVNGTLSCQKVQTKQIESNFVICPYVSLTSDSSSVSYIFNVTSSDNTTYTVDLLNAATLAIRDTNTHTDPTTSAVSDSFTGLTTATAYKVRITITVTGQPAVVCQTYDITTT